MYLPHERDITIDNFRWIARLGSLRIHITGQWFLYSQQPKKKGQIRLSILSAFARSSLNTKLPFPVFRCTELRMRSESCHKWRNRLSWSFFFHKRKTLEIGRLSNMIFRDEERNFCCCSSGSNSIRLGSNIGFIL